MIHLPKKNVHFLFTPFLFYILEYLNHNQDSKNIEDNIHSFIGKSEIDKIPIVYSLLNETIYDLFFQKINFEELNKEIVDESLNEYEEVLLENYSIDKFLN